MPKAEAGAVAPISPPRPNPEVSEKPARRPFTAADKLRILEESDACPHGELGALLRREGIYRSHLLKWRRQREAGTLDPKRRGRKPKADPALQAENDRLRRENERLAARLKKAEVIIDVQKKVSEILGLIQPDEKNS